MNIYNILNKIKKVLKIIKSNIILIYINFLYTFFIINYLN